MTIEELPETFEVPNREQLAERYRRDYRIRYPGAKVGSGTLPFIDSQTNADTLLPLYGNSEAAGRNTTLKNATSKGLEEAAERRGLPRRLSASGATGFVKISTSAGGVFIDADQEIRHEPADVTARCALADTYFDGDAVPVICITTGIASDLSAGTVMKWQSPPPGLNENAIVQATSTGKGLTGGRDEETNDGIRARIYDHDANPPAAGNSADVRKLVKRACDTLGIPVEEVFVYSASNGPGTFAFCFTLRPGSDNTSRLPSSTQIAAVLAFIKGALDGSEGIFACTMLGEECLMFIRVRWAVGARGWVDPVPYPTYQSPTPAYVVSATSVTVFRVSSVDNPAAGKTIAFYDAPNRKFVAKRILTAISAGGTQWDIVCDTSNGASDTSYKPSVNENFCPWSPSLNAIVTPVVDEFNKLGPGEQFIDADIFDEDLLLRRDPPDPDVWPSAVTSRTINPLFEVAEVSAVDLYAPSTPSPASVGTPNVSSNLRVLGRILAYP